MKVDAYETDSGKVEFRVRLESEAEYVRLIENFFWYDESIPKALLNHQIVYGFNEEQKDELSSMMGDIYKAVRRARDDR